MNTEQQINDLLFWASYYWNMFSPFLNLLIHIGFHTIIYRKVYDMIKVKYESLIEIKENIPTE